MARMIHENSEGLRHVLYMEESYIRENYARHEGSLHNPNEEQDLTKKS